MALTQTHFRFRTDGNAVDATPTWGANEDASPNPATTPFRLRLGLNSTAAASGEFEIYAKKNTGSYAAVTTSASGGIQSYDASSDADDTMLRVPRLTLSAAWWLAGAAFDLDFAGNQIYPSGAFTDYLSCSRASIGYAKNSDGTLTQFSTDTLRIGTGTGLLVEGARTNLCTYSEDFTNGAWSGVNASVTSNQATAPDGNATMDQISDDTTDSRHIIFQSVSIAPGGPEQLLQKKYASIFLKDVDRRYAAVFFYSGNSTVTEFYAFIDLQTGSLTDSGVVNATTGTVFDGATVESYSGGVYRVSLGGVFAGSAGESGAIVLALSDRSTYTGSMAFLHPSYIGSGKSIYAWGAVVEGSPTEITSFTSSYIPTTTSSATRAADLVTCTGDLATILTALPHSAIADVITEAIPNDYWGVIGSNADASFFAGNANTLLDARDNTGNGLIAGLGNSQTWTGGVKVGIAQATGARSIVGGGGDVGSDTYGIIFAGPRLGSSATTAPFIYGYIRRATFWDSKLADATLQSLTAP